VSVAAAEQSSAHDVIKTRSVRGGSDAKPDARRMSWTAPQPSWSRPGQPPGFVSTCQPTLVEVPPAGTDWMHEIKHDGYRIIARKEGFRVRVWSRNQTNMTESMAGITAAVAALDVHSATIDGEAVALHPDGHSDFAALRSRQGAAQAVLFAFDLLELDGEDLRRLPVEDRRAKLATVVGNVPEIQFSEGLVGDGQTVFGHACRLGLEGIVSKRLGSSYVSGRTRLWLKTKNRAFERR
jgi:bifunctional non-homologous end joining protein LigD